MARTSSKYFATVIAKFLDAKRKENIVIDQKYKAELKERVMARAAEMGSTAVEKPKAAAREDVSSAGPAAFISRWRYALALVPSALLVFLVAAFVTQLPVNVDTETVIPRMGIEKESKPLFEEDEGVGEPELEKQQDLIPGLGFESEPGEGQDDEQPGAIFEPGEQKEDPGAQFEGQLPVQPEVPQQPMTQPVVPRQQQDLPKVQQIEPKDATLPVEDEGFGWLRDFVLLDFFSRRSNQPLLQDEFMENDKQMYYPDFADLNIETELPEFSFEEEVPAIRSLNVEEQQNTQPIRIQVPKTRQLPKVVKDFPVNYMTNFSESDVKQIREKVLDKVDKSKVKEAYVYSRANNIVEVAINYLDGRSETKQLMMNYGTGRLEESLQQVPEWQENVQRQEFQHIYENRPGLQYWTPYQYERIYDFEYELRRR
jgi:hypothetical protein